MCGIVGFLGNHSPQLLDSMTSALGHRGPDGRGVFLDSEAGIGLGHTRLAIIDLSDAGAQPMTSGNGRFVIAFNGEIYNYRQLRDGLRQQGVAFRTGTDTEVLLEGFAHSGRAFLSKLSGIFAFAIWDRQERSLFLARDPYGVKPLYYAPLGPNGLLFSSELKALVRHGGLPRNIDPAAVAAHLGFLWTADEHTMLCAVRKLRPGQCLTVRGNNVHTEEYAAPIPLSRNGGGEGAAGQLRDLLDQVVADQMVADVPVGALLSGGLDSSAIVASMCKVIDPSRITTFCADVGKSKGGTDNVGDDTAYARIVARHLGVKLIEVPTVSGLTADLQQMVWALDEPCADFAALQVLRLASEARRNGITVLLSGVGGDDLFTGYPRHRIALLRQRLGLLAGPARLAGAVMGALPPGSMIGRRLSRFGQLLALPSHRMAIEAMSYSAVGEAGRLALLSPHIRSALAGRPTYDGLAKALARLPAAGAVDRQLGLELAAFLPDHNLNYVDKMCMLAGVEARVPLLDSRIHAFAASLPLSQLIDLRTTKKVLKESQRPRLPSAVLSRPKQGFGVPLRAWLANEARDMLEDVTSSASLGRHGLFDAQAVAALKTRVLDRRVDGAFSLFSIMAVVLWCRALDEQVV